MLCGSNSAQTPQKKLTFDQDVLPVLRDKCLGCHNADKVKGGLDASTFAKLMEGGSSGEVIKPGDSESSRLYRLVSHSDEPKMPPNSPQISKESLTLIKSWIDQGALENAGSKAVAVEKKAEIAKAVTTARPAVAPMPSAEFPRVPIVSAARSNAVTALAASPWAPLVAVAAPKSVALYNTDTLQLVGVLPFAAGQINVLHFTRSGEALLAAGGRGGHSGKAILYEIKSGKILAEVGDETDAITAADITADQSLVAVGGPGRVVRVYNVADNQKVREIKKHTEWITAIEFSPDGVLLATGDRNGGLQVWETQTGREFYSLPGHKAAITDVSWRDDGNLLASVSEDGSLKFWEMEQGRNTRSVPVSGGAQAVKFGHDNRLVITGRDRKVRLLDANGGNVREFAGLNDMGMKVAVSHDGGRVLAGDWTGTVYVWDVKDGKLAGKLTTNPNK
ncbi:MAG: c-type cytochrome domain-containing protein [Gemmataceae bacterium]